MSAKFTPGPWTLDRPTVYGAHRNISLLGQRSSVVVMFLEQLHGNKYYESMDANARLIAASPDLYAALSKYVDHFGDPGEGLFGGRAALRKADGDEK